MMVTLDDTTTMRDSSRIHVEERNREETIGNSATISHIAEKSPIKVKLTLNIIKQYIQYNINYAKYSTSPQIRGSNNSFFHSLLRSLKQSKIEILVKLVTLLLTSMSCYI